MLQHSDSATGVAVKSAPGLLYTAWVYLVGLPIEKWVSAATLTYFVLMIVHKLWHMSKEWRTGRMMPESEGDLP